MDFFHQRKTKQPTRTLKPWTDPLAKKRVETPPITTTTTTKKYDSESGQVFSESEIRFNRKQYSDWIGELRTPELTKKAVLKGTGKGARSLAAMAQSKVATQFRNLTPDHFAMVPWSSAEEIWRDLIDRRAESFHAWRTLAIAFPNADEFGQRQFRYLLNIRQPQLPVPEYFSSISSQDLKWLTCLRISPKQLTTSDLVSIHKISNLAVLDLSDGQMTIDHQSSSFDERVMRTWAELAVSKQAFQHLRVILLGWQENLSDWMFRYINDFPSLCHIVVTDCPRMHQKNRVEWEQFSTVKGWEARHAKRSAKSLRHIIGDTDFCFGSISGCYYDSLSLYEDLATSKPSGASNIVPILETWIGSPRPWSHIVEDFPSTRTIFFENLKTRSWAENKAQTKNTHTSEQAKRARNVEIIEQGSASPPAKRGPQSRPLRKPMARSMADVLAEFK